VGMAFVLPSLRMVLFLSAAHVRFGGLPWIEGMFYGVGAAVMGIIARSAFKRTITIGKNKLWRALFFVAGGLDGVDFTGDCLALSPGWSSEPVSESLSPPFAAPKQPSPVCFYIMREKPRSR
jgi:hypothetical protein